MSEQIITESAEIINEEEHPSEEFTGEIDGSSQQTTDAAFEMALMEHGLSLKVTVAENPEAEIADQDERPSALITNTNKDSSEQHTNEEHLLSNSQTDKDEVEVQFNSNRTDIDEEQGMEGNADEEEGSRQATETLFQCQLCDYTGRSKEDIADHFISTHATIQVIQSPIKAKRSGSGTAEKLQQPLVKLDSSGTSVAALRNQRGKSPAQDVTGNKDDGGLDKSPVRARSQRKRRIPKWLEDQEQDSPVIKKLREIERGKLAMTGDDEEDEEEVEKEQVDGEEEQEEEEFLEPIDMGEIEDGEIEDGEIEEGEIVKDNRDGETSQDEIMDLFQNSDKFSSLKWNDSVRPKEDDWKKYMESISISSADFEKKVDKAYADWETKWNQTHKIETIVCPKVDCAISIPASEAELHISCHMTDYLGFECIFCDERFSIWKKMRKHFSTRHAKSSGLKIDWSCDVCSKKFKMIKALKKHARTIHISSEVARSLIASYTLSELCVDKQIGTKGKPGQPQETVINPSKVEKKKGTSVEEAVEKEEKKKKFRDTRTSVKWMPTCGRCAAVYETTEELDDHISYHTIDENGQIECTECHEFFKEENLRMHMKKLHKRLINPFRCVLCEFSSKRRHDIKKHMFCHERNKRFQCDACGKLLSTPYNLKIHRLRIHATDNDKKILCSLCGFKCAERAVLKDHMRHRHDLTMSGHSRYDPSKVQLPTFPCTKCDYVGKKESSLKYHMRVHDGNRPFRCNMCTYASKTKNNLLLHVRTHNGLGPHKCPTCDFRGATSLIVKEHVMAKHTKEKPLKCPHCDWATCYNGNLWKHLQMHRMNDGVPVQGKPKRATRTGITYEGIHHKSDKLLPITSDGLLQPGDQVVQVPITIEGLGDGNTTTIMMVPASMQDEDAVNTVMTFEAQEQAGSNPGQETEILLDSSNQLQQAMNMALEEQSRQDNGGAEQSQQDDVILSVAGSSDHGMQQSMSSIITSMAASVSNSQLTRSTIGGSGGGTLIETQLSASEVASQFEDGTIIEITQIPTSGDGTALIPAGAIVERIAPGMSASDIIMKAANMVASGQLAHFTSGRQQYHVPISIHRAMTEEEVAVAVGDTVAIETGVVDTTIADTSGSNTLPFLAHVATTQESLPEVESAAITISDEMDTSVETSEAVVDNNMEQGVMDNGIEQDMVDNNAEQGMMDNNVEQGMVNDDDLKQGIVDNIVEHGMIGDSTEQGIVDNDVEQGIVDNNVEQGIVDNNVEQGIVDNNLEQCVVEQSMVDNNEEQGIVDNNVEQGMVVNNVEHGIVDNDMEQGMVDNSVEHGMIDSNEEQDIVDNDVEQAMVDTSTRQGMMDNNMEQGMVEQLVTTILPDGSNVMQIIKTQAPEQTD